MDLHLHDKVFLGTGASAGIGAATVRLGEPEDLAHVITYLLSPLARQITGAERAVDGGALLQL